jgi:hypothetical protein
MKVDWSPEVKTFVDILKKTIPANERDYSPVDKEWYFVAKYFTGVKLLAEVLLPARDYVCYTFTQEQAEAFQQPEQVVIPVKNLFAEFKSLASNAGYDFPNSISISEAKKLYKKLALFYHPDRNAGQEDAMARLNVAWRGLKDAYTWKEEETETNKTSV